MLQPRARMMLGVGAVVMVAVLGAMRCGTLTDGGVLQLPHRGVTQLPLRTIAEENALPGDRDWTITHPALAGEIAGYAGQISVQSGDTLDVNVSTRDGKDFEADVYRMGWYGGAGGRKVESVRNIKGLDQGGWDPAHGLHDCHSCLLDPATLLLQANWKRSFTIDVRADWVSGYYLIKLHEPTSDTASYAIFIVRDDDSHAPALVQASTNTWEAYNTWGDASLYGSFGADRKYVAKQRRAYKVSYDRPFDPALNDSTNNGAGLFLSWEYNFVRWAEAQGYEMSYTTNIDVGLRPETLRRHRLFVSLGHDEYWNMAQRDGVESARDNGVNVAFFSGNEAYWQARVEASSSGVPARVLTVYKDAKLDPSAQSDPKHTTVLFGDPPVRRPQAQLTGLGYGSNATPPYQPWRAAHTDSWIYKDTGIAAGEAFPGIVGYEYDRSAAPEDRPAGLTVVGQSPVEGFTGQDSALSAIYESSSGATVFAAGTIAWSWGLDDFGHDERGKFASPKLQHLTANIMNRLAAPPH